MTLLNRRDILVSAGAVSLAHLVGCGGETPSPRLATPAPIPTPIAKTGPAPGIVLAYFGRLGVDERLIREGLGAALSKGAERADLYFEHRVSTYLVLQD